MASHVEQGPVGTQLTSDSVSFQWRREQYLAMGFDAHDAERLANAKQASYTGGKTKNEKKVEWTTPLDWKKVKAALDAGCDRRMALDIFL